MGSAYGFGTASCLSSHPSTHSLQPEGSSRILSSASAKANLPPATTASTWNMDQDTLLELHPGLLLEFLGSS